MVTKVQDDQRNTGRKDNLLSRTQDSRTGARRRRCEKSNWNFREQPGVQLEGHLCLRQPLGLEEPRGSVWLAVLAGSCCEVHPDLQPYRPETPLHRYQCSSKTTQCLMAMSLLAAPHDTLFLSSFVSAINLDPEKCQEEKC